MHRKVIALIGGAGFIGTNIVKSLPHNKYEFKIFDSGFNVAGILDYEHLELGSVTQDDLYTALAGVDYVINLAAHTRVLDSIETPQITYASNVKGFFDLIEVCRSWGERLIQASTGGAIIGNAEPPIDESMMPKPLSPYGASKLFSETLSGVYTECYDMRITNFRFSNVYGPYSRNKESAVARFIKLIMAREKITVFGDGTQTRDFLFVKDLSQIIEPR